MLAVARKEIAGYFKSPIAYVLIGVYVLIMSIYFHPALKAGYGDFVDVLGDIGVFLIFIIPILTMRILAEDKKNGTEVLLLTSPTSLPRIVIGKFLATFTLFLVIVVISFIYPLIVVIFEGVITIQLVGAYIGFILLGRHSVPWEFSVLFDGKPDYSGNHFVGYNVCNVDCRSICRNGRRSTGRYNGMDIGPFKI